MYGTQKIQAKQYSPETKKQKSGIWAFTAIMPAENIFFLQNSSFSIRSWVVFVFHDSTRSKCEPMHFGCVDIVEQHSSTGSTRSTRRERLET